MHRPERYNAKARQSTAGSSKKKKGKRRNTDGSTHVPEESTLDPNAEILAPRTKEEKDAAKKERLRQQVSVFFGIYITIYAKLFSYSIAHYRL
jgi:ATP-dependent RNA helicase DHX37/DHR1